MGCSKNLNIQEFSWIDLHFFQIGYEMSILKCNQAKKK